MLHVIIFPAQITVPFPIETASFPDRREPGDRVRFDDGGIPPGRDRAHAVCVCTAKPAEGRDRAVDRHLVRLRRRLQGGDGGAARILPDAGKYVRRHALDRSRTHRADAGALCFAIGDLPAGQAAVGRALYLCRS